MDVFRHKSLSQEEQDAEFDKAFAQLQTLVDLRKADTSRLASYMGKDGVTAFRRHHAVSSVA